MILSPLGARAVTLRQRVKTQRRGRAALPIAALCVGSALVLAEGYAGALGTTESWPFACYPTFAQGSSSTHPDLQFELRSADGRVHTFTGHEHQPRTPFEWRRVLYLANAYASPATEAALLDLLSTMAARAGVPLHGATRFAIFRTELAIAPEVWGAPPVGRTKLWQLSCEPSARSEPSVALNPQCRALTGE